MSLSKVDEEPNGKVPESKFRSIDALPQEILLQITAQLKREHLLKLRLIAPRFLLPAINAIVFENLVIEIDAADDLTRWDDAEPDGVALKRLRDVAGSRIADHVRVLTLRLTRPYSLSAFYEEKLGIQKYPQGYPPTPQRNGMLRRFSSMFLRDGSKSTAASLKTAPKPTGPKISSTFSSHLKLGKKVDYGGELASALQALFKATDLVTTVRVIEPEGFNSEYDVVYPSIYGRVLVRLFTAVKDVTTMPPNVCLELLNCPISHLEESGLSLDLNIAGAAIRKFSRLRLMARNMGYAVNTPGTKRQGGYHNTGSPLRKGGLGDQFLKCFESNVDHLVSLRIDASYRQPYIVDRIIWAKSSWPALRELMLHNFEVDAEDFGHFMTQCLPHLETLVLESGTLKNNGAHLTGWNDIFEVWLTIKKEHYPDNWKLKRLSLYSLHGPSGYNGGMEWGAHINEFVKKMIPESKKKKEQQEQQLVLHDD